MSPNEQRDRAEAQLEDQNQQWIQCKGDQTCNDIWNYYESGRGGIYFLSDVQMGHIANVANSVPANQRRMGRSSWNDHQSTTVQVRFYGTGLEWALGTATLYQADDGLFIGLEDAFDFDKKCWFCSEGRKNVFAEATTRWGGRFTGVSSRARNFRIVY